MREHILGKKCFFWALPKKGLGEGGPARIFWDFFNKCNYDRWKGSLSSKMPILNFELFFGCLYIVYCMIYKVFLFLNWLLNLEFLRLEQLVQIAWIGGRGGRGVIRESPQRKHFFLQEIFPYKIVQVVNIFFQRSWLLYCRCPVHWRLNGGHESSWLISSG